MKILGTLLCIVLFFSFGLLQAQVPDYVPKNGLLGWWPFNGNANDESGNGNHGEVKGATVSKDRFGKSSSSFYFDGVNNSIEVTDSRFMDSTSITISVWFNPEDSVDNKIISKSNWENASGEMFSLFLENTLRIEFKSKSNCIPNNGWNGIILPKPSLFLNKWHHLVFSISTKYRKCYINGKLVIADSTYKEIDVCPGGQLRIGAWWSQDVNYFKGNIDDIGVWNRTLDSNEIVNLYKGVSAACSYSIKESDTTICPGYSVELNAIQTSPIKSEIPKDGLIGYWPFNGNANDESGKGNNGNVNGALLTTDRCNKANSAYKLNGIDNFVESARISLDTFTFSLWFNNQSTKQFSPLIDAYDENWEALIYGNRLKFVEWTSKDSVYNLFGSNDSIQLNEWYNFTGSYVNKEIRLYLNGKHIYSDSNIIIPFRNNGSFYFGKSQSGTEQFFNGKIDDILIWNRKLSDSEVVQVFNASPCGCTDTLSNDKFVWSDGQKGRKITVKPDTTTTYVLSVADGAILHRDSIKVTVGGDSCITCIYGIKQNDTTICQGTVLMLNAEIDTVSVSIPKVGLVGWWPFNGNANDESGNGNHGIVDKATLTLDKNNIPNSAYLFNSQGSKITIPDAQMLNNKTLSVSFWMKSSNDTNLKNFIYKTDINTANHELYAIISPSSGVLEFCVKNGSNCEPGKGWSRNKVTQSISDNIWHHVTATFDGIFSKIYIDTVLVSEIQQPFFPIDSCPGGTILFGQGWKNDANLEGILDDIAIWNRAITHAEVKTMYELNRPKPAPSIPTDGLIGYWPFDGNAKDQTSFENHGTVKGATLTTDRCQRRNAAYEFNGIDNFIELANSQSLSDVESITMSAWILLDTTKNIEQGIATKWFQLQDCTKNTDAYGLIISKSNSTGNTPKLVGFTSRYIYYQNQSTDSITNLTWQHVAFVHNKEKGGKLYLNGDVVSVYNQNGSICSSTNPLYFGADNNFGKPWRFFDGKIDDIAIWNRPLSDSEVTQVYNAGSCNCTDTLPEEKFTWSTGEKGRKITVSPNTSTMYTLAVDRGKIIDRDTIHVTVLESPTPDIFGHVKVYERQINYSYYTPFNDSSTYEWSISGNGKLSSTNGGSSILVDFKEPGYAYLTVTETNKYGCKRDTTITIRIYRMTDIAESEIKAEELNIYPNPMNEFGSVMVKAFIPPSMHASVSIVDMLGKNLITSELDGQNAYREIHLPISTESLINGVYMIQLRIDGVIVSKKLIINR